MPPTNACAPMRANWMTAAPPPRMAKSPTVQWPASMTLLEKMTLLPTLAVMADVAVGEEGAAVADDGRHAAALGAGVHGDAFADQCSRRRSPASRLALVLEVLRLMADRGEREDARCWPDRRAAGNDDVADQLDLVCRASTFWPTMQNGPMRTPVAEPGTGLDDGGSDGRFSILASSGSSDHGADLGLGHDLTVDLRFAVEPPGAAAAADFLHMIVQLVARQHRLAELGAVDPHEIDELRLVGACRRL